MAVTPFFLVTILLTLLLTDLGRVGGATVPSAASSHHGRKAQGNFNNFPGTNGGGWQWQGCGPNQCYRQDYNQCFHSTSYECTNQPEFVAATPPPTPQPVTQRIVTESPILFRLLNVAGDYVFSSSDRAKILSKIRAVLEEQLDASWEIISVESPGEYMGGRRLTSSLRGGNKRRRLNNTLYIPVVVTLRGRQDMSDMARLFILQALRNKLNIFLMYIKSLNANAFRTLQLSVNELNLADVVEFGGPTVGIQSTNTETNSSTETKTTVEAPSTGTPFWVWLIVAAVCIPLVICLLLCMCRAGWCLCCTECGSGFKRKRDTKEDYELQKQLAIERWRQQPVQKSRDDDGLDDLVAVARYGNSNGGRYEKRDVNESRRQHDVRRTRSDGARRHGERRRGDNGRRRHGERRRGDGKRRTRSDGYVSSGNSNMNYHQSDRPRPSRPVVKRSLSKIEQEIAQAEMNSIDGGSEVETKQDEPVVAALPVPASFATQNHGKDPPVEYHNALVVYDDEQIRFTLEPEAPKIEDVPKPESTALVLFNPPKEPEGDIAETPPKKSSRHYHYDKDKIYVCSPDELPRDVREKTANHSEKPQDRQRSSRRKRRSYSDKLKESFTFKRKDGQRNNDDFQDYDGVQATLGTESGSESIERRKKSKKKNRKKKKSKHRSSSHKRHDSSVASIDIENESSPSIVTAPPESDQDHPPSKSPSSQSRLFSSFRRFKSSNDSEGSDDESVEQS